jgi:glycosyltransferase involved in cell wall biosynthesis
VATILACTGCYLPGYKAGGPIRALTNTVAWLAEEYDFRILTADRDLNEKEPYADLATGVWHQVGKARVRYLRQEEGHFSRLRQIVAETPHDILYIHSFFSPFARRLLLARKLGMLPKRPTILAPRGEFSSGALGLKKTKKQAYLAWSRWAGLCDGVTWQATSLLEQEDIRRWWRTSTAGIESIVLAPNLPTLADGNLGRAASRGPKVAGAATIVFLGRVSPIKNLHLSLEALSEVQGDVAFDIFGPLEDRAYWEKCQKFIRSLPTSVRVEYRGPLPPDQVEEVLSRYQLFLMLSDSENFGHAILEAMAAGCVPLIGNCTPWQGLAAKGVGWDIPPRDISQVRRAMQDFLALDEYGFARMSAASQEMAQAFRHSDDNLNAYRRLFAAGGVVQESEASSRDGYSRKEG